MHVFTDDQQWILSSKEHNGNFFVF